MMNSIIIAVLLVMTAAFVYYAYAIHKTVTDYEAQKQQRELTQKTVQPSKYLWAIFYLECRACGEEMYAIVPKTVNRLRLECDNCEQHSLRLVGPVSDEQILVVDLSKTVFIEPAPKS